MPIISSRAQSRWAFGACKSGRGKTKKAACDAVREAHGRKLSNLPERKAKSRKRRGRKSTRG